MKFVYCHTVLLVFNVDVGIVYLVLIEQMMHFHNHAVPLSAYHTVASLPGGIVWKICFNAGYVGQVDLKVPKYNSPTPFYFSIACSLLLCIIRSYTLSILL